MEVEKYFLQYAYPCADVLVDVGSLSKEKYEELGKTLENNNAPSRKEMEEIFVAAFRRLKKLAKEMNKDYWDMEVMKKYWLENHNENIDEGEGNYSKFPESFKDLCRVHKAKIIEKKDNLLTVKYGEKIRTVRNDFVPDANVGDTATIHHAYAIEIL